MRYRDLGVFSDNNVILQVNVVLCGIFFLFSIKYNDEGAKIAEPSLPTMSF